jgi:hypothetical protein
MPDTYQIRKSSTKLHTTMAVNGEPAGSGARSAANWLVANEPRLPDRKIAVRAANLAFLFGAADLVFDGAEWSAETVETEEKPDDVERAKFSAQQLAHAAVRNIRGYERKPAPKLPSAQIVQFPGKRRERDEKE